MRHSRRRIRTALIAAGLVAGLALIGAAAFLGDDDSYSRVEDRLYLGQAVPSPPWRTGPS
jgi:hypothetical protein